MSMRQPLAGAARSLAFARHMPLAKLVRRAELDLKRRVRDRLGGRLASRKSSVLIPDFAQRLPAPLFAPRTVLAPARRADGGYDFRFLGRSIAMAGPEPDWQALSVSAADQLWRMNLHYMEYLEGVDDALFGTLVRSWIARNPGGARGAWRDSWNSYALSLRVVVWLQELQRRAGRLPRDVIDAVRESVVEQLRFLVTNLETDLGGNHLVKNIKALIWASRCFDGGEAKRWGELGVDLLSRELSAQVLADGMHYERSPSYHAQVFADLLECRGALGSDPLGGRLDRALHAMAQALVDLTHPDGSPALFNDSGLSMAYSPRACLAAYAGVFGRRPAPRDRFALSASGYWGLRSGESYAVIDCGRIAPDDLPAHGHGDVLSFEWSVGGERLIVDQGVFEYVAGDKRRQSRSAMNHNTLCFEGADQADFFGAFRCGRRPDVAVRAYRQLEDGFVLEGSHDGFRSLSGRLHHVRSFEATARTLEISDRIEGETSAPARVGLLLHPEASVSGGNREFMLSRRKATVRLRSSHPVVVEPAVWWPDMGTEIATSRLVMRLHPGERVACLQLDVLEA